MIYNLAMTHVFVFENDEAAPNLLRVWMMWRPEGRGQCGLIRMQWVTDCDAGDGDSGDAGDAGDAGEADSGDGDAS